MNLYRSIVHLSLFVCPLAVTPLQWRLNGCDGVSNHQPHHCSLNRLFRRRSKKTSKLCITGLCAGNSPLTGEFPAQMAGNAEMFLFDDVIMTLWGVLSRKLPELETNMHVLHTFQNPLTLMLSWLNLDDILSKPHSGGWFEKQIFPSNVLPMRISMLMQFLQVVWYGSRTRDPEIWFFSTWKAVDIFIKDLFHVVSTCHNTVIVVNSTKSVIVTYPKLLQMTWQSFHDDVIKWKHFPCYWPSVWEIHRWNRLTEASDAELWCLLWSAPE